MKLIILIYFILISQVIGAKYDLFLLTTTEHTKPDLSRDMSDIVFELKEDSDLLRQRIKKELSYLKLIDNKKSEKIFIKSIVWSKFKQIKELNIKDKNVLQLRYKKEIARCHFIKHPYKVPKAYYQVLTDEEAAEPIRVRKGRIIVFLVLSVSFVNIRGNEELISLHKIRVEVVVSNNLNTTTIRIGKDLESDKRLKLEEDIGEQPKEVQEEPQTNYFVLEQPVDEQEQPLYASIDEEQEPLYTSIDELKPEKLPLYELAKPLDEVELNKENIKYKKRELANLPPVPELPPLFGTLDYNEDDFKKKKIKPRRLLPIPTMRLKEKETNDKEKNIIRNKRRGIRERGRVITEKEIKVNQEIENLTDTLDNISNIFKIKTLKKRPNYLILDENIYIEPQDLIPYKKRKIAESSKEDENTKLNVTKVEPLYADPDKAESLQYFKTPIKKYEISELKRKGDKYSNTLRREYIQLCFRITKENNNLCEFISRYQEKVVYFLSTFTLDSAYFKKELLDKLEKTEEDFQSSLKWINKEKKRLGLKTRI